MYERETIPPICLWPHKCDYEGGRIGGVLLYKHMHCILRYVWDTFFFLNCPALVHYNFHSLHLKISRSSDQEHPNFLRSAKLSSFQCNVTHGIRALHILAMQRMTVNSSIRLMFHELRTLLSHNTGQTVFLRGRDKQIIGGKKDGGIN